MKVLTDKEINGQKCALILLHGKDSPEWVKIEDVPQDKLEKYYRSKRHHQEKQKKETEKSETKTTKEASEPKEEKPKPEKKGKRSSSKNENPPKEETESPKDATKEKPNPKPRATKTQKIKLEKIAGIFTADKKNTTFIVKLKDQEPTEMPYSELKKHYAKELLDYLMDHVVLENK